MERLLIGLDIDGVIADAVSVMLPLLSEVCNRPVTHRDIRSRNLAEALNIDEPSVRYVWEQTINNGLLHNASPIEGALEGLAALDGHEVWFVTARPAFLKDLTESWLGERRVRYDRILFDRGGDKASAGPGFDMFVDDFLEEAGPVAEAGVFTLLYDQPWNQAPELPGNCVRVYDWDGIVKAVSELETRVRR